MKALITGAGGFIGSHLAKQLLKQGHEVRGLFLPAEDTAGLKDDGMEVVRGDLTAPETLRGIADGMDTVFHLATRTLDWGTRQQFETIMVGGTKNLLEECRGNIKRFIYFSSVAAMGLGVDLLGATENTARKYCGVPYCDTKIEAEDLVSDVCNKNNMEFTIIRPANVTGPKSVWVTEIIEAFLRGPVPLISGGKAPGAFIYVDNLAEGAILAATSDIAAGHTYFFRDNYDITWKEYLEFIGGLVGKKPFSSIPFKIAWRLGSLCETMCAPLGIRPPLTRLAAGVMGKNNDVDCTRAKTELGWKTIIDQDTALQKIKTWVQKVYLPSRENKKE
ncbi:MAG: NAD-dependent epimerase/dehydratase family protein [Deltaproteobacteria bacterium]|nr:NAD-dependent epimerase/dehydratase family protein [Deltaproteobacteria bacterium]